MWSTYWEVDYGLKWDNSAECWVDGDGAAYDGRRLNAYSRGIGGLEEYTDPGVPRGEGVGLMARCEAIKADGTRCKGTAMGGYYWCWNHNPENASVRQANASRGGKTGGRGRPSSLSSELARLQEDFERLAERVIAGTLERGAGAVAGQLLNGARACIRDAIAAREQEELVVRLEAIEHALDQRGSNRWG